jgi:hypothetical protein
MSKLPDAKVVAMVNDLSIETLAGLLCFYPELVALVRQWVTEQYRGGRLPASVIVEAWADDRSNQ